FVDLVGKNADRGFAPGRREPEQHAYARQQQGDGRQSQRLADRRTKRQEADNHAKQEEEQPDGSEAGTGKNVAQLAQWQVEHEDLEHEKQDQQRRHRQQDAGRRACHVGDPRRVHHHRIPMASTAMMAPVDAMPITPNPSDTASRPAITAVSPRVSEITTGAVRTPVVALPASKASGTKSAGAMIPNPRMST